MKKIKFLSVFFMLCAITFASCNTEDSEPVNPVNQNPENPTDPENPTEPETPPAVFAAVMNGSPYVADVAKAGILHNTITITGMRGTGGEAVTFVISGTEEGTYTDAYMYYTQGTGSNVYMSKHPYNLYHMGSVAITALDTANNTISGNFNFPAYYIALDNLFMFENGVFENVPIEDIVPNPEPMAGGFIHAKVNAPFFNFYETGSQYTDTGKLLVVAHSPRPDYRIAFMVPAEAEVGTYAISPDPEGIATATFFNYSQHMTAPEGTIEITSNSNGWITGKINFTVIHMNILWDIQEGEFHVKLPE